VRNDETGAIRQYHELTKHSVESLQAGPRGLDWTNQPIPFKIYLDVERFPLPRDLSAGEVSMLSALAASGELSPPPPDPIHVDLFALARVLYFSAGITKVRRHGDAATYFRAAPNTGALYHIDVYVICRDLDGLPAGVYHFDPRDFTLGRLREGDYRGLIVQATAAEPTVATAPVVLATASTYWRNAWKYRARAWRHAFWDGGTLQANLLAVAAALGLRPRVVLGFVDRDIEHLLGLDPGREGALSLVPLGRDPEAPAPVDALEDPDLRTERLSPQEIEYPEIVAAQEASSLETPDRVASWRDAVPAREVPAAAGRTFPLRPLTVSEWPQDPLEQVIRRRGSTRRFDASCRSASKGSRPSWTWRRGRFRPTSSRSPGRASSISI
jgi:SagB-type dehydrogenase family enzyme